MQLKVLLGRNKADPLPLTQLKAYLSKSYSLVYAGIVDRPIYYYFLRDYEIATLTTSVILKAKSLIYGYLIVSEKYYRGFRVTQAEHIP
jgi:hypothetical protein